jgi:hypothetical protein
VIGMDRLIVIYDHSKCLYLRCKVSKVKLEVAIRIGMENAWKLRVSGTVEDTAPGHCSEGEAEAAVAEQDNNGNSREYVCERRV